MKRGQSAAPEDAIEEITLLVATLHRTEQRLEELTGGEVDAVADSQGRPFLLRRAQEELRRSDVARQAAILNALPANIALLDAHGVIVLVNEAWRGFATTNVLQSPGYVVGVNYLGICDKARGNYSAEAHEVAAGIRSVLTGEAGSFAIEYPCHAPTEQCWFLLTVTPLAKGRPNGAVVMHLNITERKRAEAALQASEERFSSAFEYAPIGMALVSPEGRWLKVNRALCELVGYSAAELLTRTFQDITHPDDLAGDLAYLWRMLAGEISSYQMEKRYLHARGHVVTVLLNVSLVSDREGQPRYFISQIQDITARNQAEESLRLSQASMAAAQRIGHFGSWELDLTKAEGAGGTPARWSDEMFRIVGLEPGAVEASREFFFRIIPREEHEMIRQAVAAAIAERRSYTTVHRFIRPDGEVRIVQETAQIYFDEDTGQPLKIIGNAHDITERELTETALRASKKRLRDLIDGLGASMLVGLLTPEGLVLEANTSALAAAGLKPEDVLGKPLEEARWFAYSADAQRQLRAAIARAVQGEASRYDMKIRGTGDRLIDIDFALNPVRDESGEVIFLVPSGSVITERKEAEVALAHERHLLRELLDNSTDQIYFKDAQSRFLRFSKTQMEIFGIKDAAALVGRTDADFFDTEHADAAYADEQAIMRTGVPLIGKVEKEIWRGGRETWVLTSKMPLHNPAGEIIGTLGISKDITTIKTAEAQLAREQARFRFIFESMPLGVCLVSRQPDGGFERIINDAYLGICGLTREQDQRPGIYEQITHPADFARQAELRRELDEGTTGERWMEMRFTRPDGERVWAVLSYQRHHYADGSSEELTTLINITGLKKADSALRESNEKFQQLVDNINDVFWIRSPDLHEVQYISPAFERIWGRSVASLYANPQQWSDFILPEDRERVLAAFAALKGDVPSLDMEYRIMRPDGEIRWVQVRGVQVRNAASELIRHIGIVSDITLRKQVEAVTRQSQERYRSVIDNASDAIFTIALDGTFTSLNPAVETIAGLSRADWIGKSFTAMVHPDDLPVAREMFALVMQGRPAPVHTLRGNSSLPRPALMEMTLAALKDGEGKITGVLGIGRDITDRKRLEEQLFQSQKMETVGKLAGGVAHEFNSIMTAIIGQSELLLGDLPAGSPLVRNATEIRKAADRAAALTRQLLAFGRKQQLQPEILDLNAILAGLEDTIRHLTGRGVDVGLVPAGGLGAVKADAAQIEQVIINMVANAADAMPSGGKLTIETTNIELEQESIGQLAELKPGRYVMFAVTDTGTGMTAEVKARLFEPFFSTKGVGQGTGLGLSTCYGIVRQSGGHISVYSELGRGTTFRIYLPRVELQETVPVRQLAATDMPRGTETILLVEDDPALREMVAILLRRLGYTVMVAANGGEALGLIRHHAPGRIDLLFTDLVMPHMSGDELAERVRATSPLTKVLFTTAFAENAMLHQGVLQKGMAQLPKPYTPSVLARKLREVLDQAGPRHR